MIKGDKIKKKVENRQLQRIDSSTTGEKNWTDDANNMFRTANSKFAPLLFVSQRQRI